MLKKKSYKSFLEVLQTHLVTWPKGLTDLKSSFIHVCVLLQWKDAQLDQHDKNIIEGVYLSPNTGFQHSPSNGMVTEKVLLPAAMKCSSKCIMSLSKEAPFSPRVQGFFFFGGWLPRHLVTPRRIVGVYHSHCLHSRQAIPQVSVL